MRIPLSALLISSLLVAGCGGGGGSFNPFNWFGRGQADPVATDSANPLIPAKSTSFFRKADRPYTGVLVMQIKDLKVEKTPGGALIRVTGVSQIQGPYEVRLVPLNKNQPVDRTVTYELRAEMPTRRVVQGTEWSRTIAAATFLTDNELAGVRTIRVVGATNSLSARR